MSETCGQCHFFDRVGKRAMGACRRKPPRVVALDDRSFTEWPEVDEAEYCGSFVRSGEYLGQGDIVRGYLVMLSELVKGRACDDSLKKWAEETEAKLKIQRGG